MQWEKVGGLQKHKRNSTHVKCTNCNYIVTQKRTASQWWLFLHLMRGNNIIQCSLYCNVSRRQWHWKKFDNQSVNKLGLGEFFESQCKLNMKSDGSNTGKHKLDKHTENLTATVQLPNISWKMPTKIDYMLPTAEQRTGTYIGLAFPTVGFLLQYMLARQHGFALWLATSRANNRINLAETRLTPLASQTVYIDFYVAPLQMSSVFGIVMSVHLSQPWTLLLVRLDGSSCNVARWLASASITLCLIGVT